MSDYISREAAIAYIREQSEGCDNCGYEDNTSNAKYCGGCGAKMDLEGENE